MRNIFVTIILVFSVDHFVAAQVKNEDTNAQPTEVETARANDKEVEKDSLRFIFPEKSSWNHINEGEPASFSIRATGGGGNYKFTIIGEDLPEISLDSAGNFLWKPGYDFVSRLEGRKTLPLFLEVRDNQGLSHSEKINLVVYHVNRPPIVGDQKNFYVQFNIMNTYQLDMSTIIDDDNDPVIIKPIASQMPEGAKLSQSGEFTWKPSLGQFQRLKRDPVKLSFIVEDQPAKAQTTGTFVIAATQMDLPPEFSMIPKVEEFKIKEDETINIKFYLSDPNGDDDISVFDFISEDLRVPKNALKQNTITQREFIWTPGYNFVTEYDAAITFDMTFFVLDKTNKREERKVRITVANTENLYEKDRLLHKQYRAALVRTWDLLEQLKDKEKELKRTVKKARRGKRGRGIANASIGAVTGISPIVFEGDDQKAVTAVGGTTVMTIGTLEATDMLGESPLKLLEQLNYILEKKNELQIQGDIFARKYAITNSRRGDAFKNDLDKLMVMLNVKNLASLDLDANWKNKKDASDSNIKDTFSDYNSAVN